jgi:hypothetical protein
LCDNDATMEGWNEWKKRIRKYSIDPKYTEPYLPFQNKAELDLRELKRMVRVPRQDKIPKATLELPGKSVFEDKVVDLGFTSGFTTEERF